MKGLCFIVLCLQLTAVKAQKKILGNYTQDVDFIAESDIYFEFFKDGSFLHEAWDDVGDYIGVGKYKLVNDSLFLRYQEIPDKDKQIHIIKKNRQDSLSTLVVINSLNRRNAIQVAYENVEEKKQIKIGNADALGKVYFSLKENQYLKVIAHQLNSNSILQQPIEFKISFENNTMDYFVFSLLVRINTHCLGEKTESYPVKVYRKGKCFGIKKNNEWLMFEKL